VVVSLESLPSGDKLEPLKKDLKEKISAAVAAKKLTVEKVDVKAKEK
jgi:hypothetical protein